MRHRRSGAERSASVAAALARTMARVLLSLYPRDFRDEVAQEVVRDHVARSVTLFRRKDRVRWAGWLLRSMLALGISAAGAWVDRLRYSRRSITTSNPAGDANPTSLRPEPAMRLAVFDAIRQDVSYALRGMRRSPGFTTMVVLTLALGVGANAAVYSVLAGIFGVPAGLEDPGTLRRLYLAPPQTGSPDAPPDASDDFSYPSFSGIDEAVGDWSAVAAWSETDEATVSLSGSAFTARATWVTHDFLSVLGVNPAQGRFFAADEGAVDTPARVVVLSHDFWAEAFGAAPGIVGGSVAINDTAYTVIGVAEQGFRGLDVSMTDVFLPLGTYPDVGQPALGLSWFEWGGSLLRAVARLSTPDAEAVLTGRATAGYRAQPEIPRYLIDRTNVVLAGPIVQARGPGQLEGPIPISIRTAGVAAVVLLIACANVASLLLVRATRRRRELAVRLTLGVSRGRLFGQLLTESVALGSVAGAAACLVGVWGGSVLRGLLLPSVAWARPLVESRTVLLVMLVAAGGGLLAGLAPALSGSKADASSALKSGAHGSGGRWLGARSLLLVVQGALSIVLVVGAALFVRSLGRLDALDLGYDTDRLVRASVTMRGERPNAAAIRETSERIAALPGVTGVALASSMPMSGWSGATVYIAGRQMPLTDPSAIFIRVTPEFFEVAGMALQEGRTFERGEGAVAVVNETLARTLAPGGSAVGQCLLLGDADAECTRVIGVSEDARRGQILEEQRPQFFVPLNEGRETAILARFSGDGRPIAAAARSKLERTFEPGIVRVERMSDALATQLRPWRLGAQLFSGFGLLALVVTSVGVYSVMAYTVSQRTHEMGVRIALGARVHDVLRLVLRDGLRVIGLAIAVGIVAALVLGRLVASLLYGVTPRDPVAMGAAAAVLLAVGLLACLIPAWRAARVDPVRALSAE